eukprot:115776-Prymnesium_polylepis.1
MISTDGGYRHVKGARVGEFKDVCEGVVRALVAFVRRVTRQACVRSFSKREKASQECRAASRP